MPSPIRPNIAFVGSRRIAPSWHVGPRGYSAAGFIPHPLGHATINAVQPMPLAHAGQMLSSAQLLANAFPHPYTLNGRAPG